LSLEGQLRAIEDTRGHIRLGCEVDGFFGVVADDRHRVGIDLKAGIGPRDVVGDDEIDVLALQLHPAALHDRRSRRQIQPGPA